jgi:hypothetical protein
MTLVLLVYQDVMDSCQVDY